MALKPLKSERVTLARVKAVLEGRQREGELTGLQKATLGYVAKFSKLSLEKAEELVGRLMAEFGLGDGCAIQIVNVMPFSVDELRPFVFTEKKTFLTSDLEKMLRLIDEYRGR